jgi:hypothetical protein
MTDLREKTVVGGRCVDSHMALVRLLERDLMIGGDFSIQAQR